MKTLDTILPDALFCQAAGNRELFMKRVATFIEHFLMPILEQVEDSFSEVSLTMFGNENEDSTASILIRMAHRTAVVSCKKLIEAYREYLKVVEEDVHYTPSPSRGGDEEAMANFFSATISPPYEMYHPGKKYPSLDPVVKNAIRKYPAPDENGNHPFIVADLIGRIHEQVLSHHLNVALLPDYKGKMRIGNQDDAVDPVTNLPLIARHNPIANDILSFIADIDAYAFIPEDLKGTLLPSATEEEQKKPRGLLEQGANSAIYVTKLTDERICSWCKLHFVTVGMTDETEQRTRYECSCVLMPHLPDANSCYQLLVDEQERPTDQLLLNRNPEKQQKAESDASNFCMIAEENIRCRAGRAARALYITRQYFARNRVGGCKCADHVKLFEHSMGLHNFLFDDITAFRTGSN